MLDREVRTLVAKRIVFSCFAFLMVALTGCGGGLNFNKLVFGTDNEKDALDYILLDAQLKYDRGEFTEALTLAEKARAIKSDSEQVNILLGFIKLSLAGIDPLQVAIKLVDLSTTSTSTSSTTSLADVTSTASSDTAGQMQKLSVLINLTSDDSKKLGAVDQSSVSYWKDIDVIRPCTLDGTDPNCATSPRQAVPTLASVSEVIQLICPFVDSDIMIENYEISAGVAGRHVCTATTQYRSHRAKSHLLWALGHLTEALALNTILLYSTDTSGKGTPNIQRRVDAMNAKTFSGSEVGTYLDLVGEVATLVDTVFDTNKNSMLTATLVDMKSFLAGASKAGMPEDTVKSVSSAMTQLEKTAKDLGGGASGDIAKQTEALRGQMNNTVAKSVSEKLNKVKDSLSDEQKSDACDSFDKLAAGLTTENKNLPEFCK